MPPGVSLQSDLTAGELSPSLLARVEFVKYNKGARTMRNFFVQSHGPAVRRPGFELIGALPGEAVLVDFVFNNEQTYVLIFGERWMRVATHDGFVLGANNQPYQIHTPYTLAQARQLSYTQSADVLFIACHGVAPQRLMRLSHADWRFEAMDFSAPIQPPAWGVLADTFALAYPPYKVSATSEVLVENKGEFKGVRIEEPLYREESGAYTLLTGKTLYYYAAGDATWKILSPTDTEFLSYGLYKKMDESAIRFVNDAKNSDGTPSQAQTVTPYSYYVTSIDADGKESELSGPAGITGPSSNNWQAGDYIVFSWLPVAGAEEYRIYKASFGGRPGYVATVGDTAFKDHNVAPVFSEGAPKYMDPFPGGDYPGAVGLFEQRLVFASTPKRPQTIWMSKSGDYSNFAVYDPVTDDAPIELTIASPEVSPVNWMVPLRSLIFGTPGMEWEITGRNDAAFTARNAKAAPQSYWGSSLRRATVVGNVILHISSSGSQVRNLQYDFGSDSYGGTDLSILASHLLEEHKIVDWTYQKNPDSIIWCVRSDGVLLGLTFQAEHQIAAWHRHDTQGKFTAVRALPHGYEHSLFAIVARNGVHYLERMAERYRGGDPSRAVFMDCASTYEGPATKTISNLGHLEGMEVGIFSMGAVEAPRTVSGGRITLDSPTTLATVGLLYTADLETMPVEIVGQQGTSVALKKQINTVNIAFHESLGVSVGLTTTPGDLSAVRWQEVKWRTTEPHGKPPAPFTGVKHLTMPNAAENILAVCIRSELPTPVTVQSIVTRIEVKG